MINPLDAWRQHATASEEMDLTGAGSHQKKGYNFAQNFPSLVPGGGVTATQWVGPALSKGYQYAQELGRSILPEGFLGGTNISLTDAWKKAGVESDANIQGMLGKDFNKDEYNEWMAEHGYGPEYDFSDIKGQTAGLGVASFLVEKFGPKVGAYLFNTGKHKALNKIRKKVSPGITGVLTGGQAQAGAPPTTGQGGQIDARDLKDIGGGFHEYKDSGTAASYEGSFRKGGRASYFDGGLASLWPRQFNH